MSQNEEIFKLEQQIRELRAKRNKLNAITADGVPIEIGMRLYCVDICGFDTFIVPELVEFRENDLLIHDQYKQENYLDLYYDFAACIRETTRRVKDQVIRTERAYIAAQDALEKVEQNIKKDINEQFEGQERLEALLTFNKITVQS